MEDKEFALQNTQVLCGERIPSLISKESKGHHGWRALEETDIR